MTTLFLAFGLIMEFPILLFGLSRVGIVTSERLGVVATRSSILGIAIFAAAVTPGGDLVSPLVLGGDDVPALRGHDLRHQAQRQVSARDA